MAPALTFLDGVRWQGTRLAGDRAQALLAVLALHAGTGLSDERLVEELWSEESPANPTKALQVVVSRTRAATHPDVVVRTARGYRLGLPADQVDALLLASLAGQAREALGGGDTAVARRRAEEAVALVASGFEPSSGPLADVRADAAKALEEARRVLAVARSRDGDHAGALPLLEEYASVRPHDEELLACLLRSEAAVRGVASALERFERYRADLAEHLGADPGPELTRVHAALLAADRPVREGILYDGSSLLGRDDDIRSVHALLQTGRVVSIVGAGGLGKTRLAHVVGRNAAQPVAHFVELVAVSSPEGVVGEVGSALGVRDSVTARRVLTPQQRSDVRSRIAGHLDQVPSLLILDNCEHVIEAVADLVAFLVANTRDLRVLTTSRAPLSIPAERVHQLGELATGDSVELFGQRATAARPGVRLEEEAVREIVTRLDGLPLAIELAAAKVRVMSVEEIRRRLADRFALLRGGNRSAPDRHQTLLAVIDWSWNLLDEQERRALRRMSLFGDGFTLETAEHVLGPGALQAVHALTEQSLLSVRENAFGLRYRMLETVREFGLMRLAEAGEEAQARTAQQTWATEYGMRHAAALFGADQFAAVDALRAEEGNLADLLRRALAEGDPAMAVRLMSAVGPLWSVRGDHPRIIALGEALTQTITGWFPPPELEDLTRVTLLIMLMNLMVITDSHHQLRDLLARLPDRDTTDRRLTAMTRVTMASDPANGESALRRLTELSQSTDHDLALFAGQMLTHALENTGDTAGAAAVAERTLALTGDDDGPWTRAIMRATLAHLAMQAGDPERAAGHARAALPVMIRIGATDDEAQLRAIMMYLAIQSGDLATAEAELAELMRINESEAVQGGLAIIPACAAELALARGDVALALSEYRLAVQRARDLRLAGLPKTGVEPWVMVAASVALTVHAYHAGPADLWFGEELFATQYALLRDEVLSEANTFLDYPVAGMTLFSLGAWGLLRGALPPRVAIRLLVLAERFSYNQMMASMAFERIEPHAESAVPGLIAAVRAEYGDRRGHDLLGEARRALRDHGSHVTLVAAHGQRREDRDADQAGQ
ncbi:transcriptional regulator [Nonomuraea sp. NN258]|uniref:ATP-binding protein n=1 Tax=Nonomuraea antri TaxID=2730852 RepID=UPI00156918D7|nr:BTAD domain-containing putative transcriptional regulator [Nonomuraea antri]NRQ30245.1 transcriptional regulator [Nonomuraea antri]